MTIVISKDQNGKQVCKYKAANGLIFNYKDHCIMYENKYMVFYPYKKGKNK